MFKSYLKAAFRNLRQNKVFSLINIIGLSVGLACCMLILLYTMDEVSYDRFHEKKDRIYRVVADLTGADGNVNKYSSTGMMPGPAFKRQIPEIENFVRIKDVNLTARSGTDAFEQDALYVDDDFFSVFSFPMLQGDPATALRNINSVVLSEESAEKYFGRQNALGRFLDLKINDSFRTFIVSGIAKKSPQNSSIKIHMLLPMKLMQTLNPDDSWLNFFLNTFVIIKPGSDITMVKKKMKETFKAEAADQLKDAELNHSFKDKINFGLQPLPEMHMSADYPADNGLRDASNPIYTYILSGIALFILLIACVNFINLTLAKSLKRAKEIGIRKVVGGLRSQLVAQFLGESCALSLIAFLLAIILVILTLPFFNALANKSLSFSYLLDAKLITGYLISFLVTALLAGFYPALVLSRFNPVQSLYNRQQFSGENYLSKALVVFQFTLATFFIIAAITFYSQFNYLMHYDLGYNFKNVVLVQAPDMDRQKLALLQNELLKSPSIKNVTANRGGRIGTSAYINNKQEIGFDIQHVDENYVTLFDIPVIEGRNFSKNITSDSAQSVLVNEEFVKKAGWKNPLGQVVDFFYMNKKYTVIGVIKDYHFLSLKDKMGPEILSMRPDLPYNNVYIKLREGNTSQSLSFIEKTFKRLYPFEPYQYTFKYASNKDQYDMEATWKQIIAFGASLTIFISCIGLFGLATFSAEKRKKEIGIRKVLGASVEGIVGKLSNDFLKLVVLSAGIASPAAWWAMNKWLDHYPYRIAMNGWIFFYATLSVLLIALMTVSYHSIKASLTNPVDSLRME